MNTYSYYDYGLRPSYQGTFDADTLEDAMARAQKSGLKLHRVTPVVGVRILVIDTEHPRTAATFLVTPKFNSKPEALRFLRDHVVAHVEHPKYEYAYPMGKSFDPLSSVTEPIDDLKAEYEKYGL